MRITAFLLLTSLGAAAQVSVGVPGNRVITLAGQPAGARSANNARSAPADSPILVNMPLSAGQALEITATGAVDGYGPEGRTGCNDSYVAEYAITRIVTPCRALIGVFLADTTRAQPAAGIDFSGDARHQPILRPLIQQPFFIGSGVTPTGDRKAFVVPAGATRLFLSPLGNANSSGEFTATVRVVSLPETPSNPIRVSGVSVISLANQPAGTLSSNNNARIAPMHSPAQLGMPLLGGQVLRIVATGAVDGYGPDGRTGCNDSFSAEFAVARVDARCRALIGVFLADSARSQPPNLNFTGATRNTVRVEPLIQQPFLIGSGYTDGGDRKEFVVPVGATRLYFASMGNPQTPGFFTVTVSPVAAATPVVERSGIVRAAGYGGGTAAAGSLLSIFGSNLADVSESATSVPLPIQISQTRVYINLRPAPLFFTSSGQINAQIPWEFANDTSVQLVVVRNGAASLPAPVDLAAASPGIFLLRENAGVVVNATNGQLADQEKPVRGGDTLVIYASGLGPVTGTVRTGAPASSTELEPLQAPVEASLQLAGQTVTLPVQFAGSAPGFIGVNQVNAAVPVGTPAGVGSLKLRTRGVDSNSVLIAVQQ